MEPELVSGIAGIRLESAPESRYDGLFYGQAYLSNEQRNVIFEILRCAVCLELPRLTAHNQVFICENGHHFCQSCHVRLNSCAVCRGALGAGRNFVVEELLNKLGRQLGIVKPPYYNALPPPPIPKGTFYCPHGCGSNATALNMLQHIRDAHDKNLNDKIRSNPHSGWFEAAFEVKFVPGNKYARSYQISDMGLLTVVVLIPNDYDQCLHQFKEINGHVQMLQINTGFVCNISITHGSTQSVRLNVDVNSFSEIKPCSFDIRDAKINDTIIINFLVRRTESLKPVPLSWPNSATEVATFATDRPSRRTLKRNQRRKLVRKKMRQIRINNLLQGATELNNSDLCPSSSSSAMIL